MQHQQRAPLPTTQQVIVERSFYYERKPLPKGAKVTLPYLFAKEMEAAKKVSFVKPVEPVQAAAQEPAASDSKADVKAKKGEAK
jgi:hypothetical protein